MTGKTLFQIFSENFDYNLKKIGMSINFQGEQVTEKLYLCPISMRCYTEEALESGELTIEHVPPKSLKGKGILLTSKEVNNKDGQSSDKRLLKFFESENFKINIGSMDGSVSSETLGFQGIRTKISIDEKNGKPKIQIISPKKNMEALKRHGFFEKWDGNKFNIKWQQQLNLDKKALLKCAYLTAISRIGYELILDTKGFKKETYGALISYLNSSNLDIDFPVLFIDEHAPLSNSPLGVINSPADLQCFFVNLSFKLNGSIFKYCVFLPHPESKDLGNLENLKMIMTKSDYFVDLKISEITMDIRTEANN